MYIHPCVHRHMALHVDAVYAVYAAYAVYVVYVAYAACVVCALHPAYALHDGLYAVSSYAVYLGNRLLGDL